MSEFNYLNETYILAGILVATLIIGFFTNWFFKKSNNISNEVKHLQTRPIILVRDLKTVNVSKDPDQRTKLSLFPKVFSFNIELEDSLLQFSIEIINAGILIARDLNVKVKYLCDGKEEKELKHYGDFPPHRQEFLSGFFPPVKEMTIEFSIEISWNYEKNYSGFYHAIYDVIPGNITTPVKHDMKKCVAEYSIKKTFFERLRQK